MNANYVLYLLLKKRAEFPLHSTKKKCLIKVSLTGKNRQHVDIPQPLPQTNLNTTPS